MRAAGEAARPLDDGYDEAGRVDCEHVVTARAGGGRGGRVLVVVTGQNYFQVRQRRPCEGDAEDGAGAGHVLAHARAVVGSDLVAVVGLQRGHDQRRAAELGVVARDRGHRIAEARDGHRHRQECGHAERNCAPDRYGTAAIDRLHHAEPSPGTNRKPEYEPKNHGSPVEAVDTFITCPIEFDCIPAFDELARRATVACRRRCGTRLRAPLN